MDVLYSYIVVSTWIHGEESMFVLNIAGMILPSKVAS